MTNPTREATIYRLTDVSPDLDGLLGILDAEWLDGTPSWLDGVRRSLAG